MGPSKAILSTICQLPNSRMSASGPVSGPTSSMSSHASKSGITSPEMVRVGASLVGSRSMDSFRAPVIHLESAASDTGLIS